MHMTTIVFLLTRYLAVWESRNSMKTIVLDQFWRLSLGAVVSARAKYNLLSDIPVDLH